ncbi:MAG: metallophosphoesterase, partial [Saprospiraceae bacterium]|nr:metallophosphoesterase [Saprospiraceae bacterium]
ADFMDVFDKIRAKYGVFSVLGNHDYGDYVEWPSHEAKQQNLEKMIQIHKTLGWRLLMNEHEKLSINGQELAIIGVENYSALSRFPKHGDLEKACFGIENGGLKILLSHDPSHWDAQVNQRFQDIALTFSGHTHGCQFGVEIPGMVKWSPIQYLYKQWAGLYRKGEQFIYVNRGLGFIGYPGRVGILPEVAVIELSKA